MYYHTLNYYLCKIHKIKPLLFGRLLLLRGIPEGDPWIEVRRRKI